MMIVQDIDHFSLRSETLTEMAETCRKIHTDVAIEKKKKIQHILNIYSITPINWVIIKQEGTNRIRQNNAPFLALQSFFSTATRYFPVIRPEQFSSPNGDHAHKKSPEEYTLPSRHPPETLPSLMNGHTASRFLVLMSTSYGSMCH